MIPSTFISHGPPDRVLSQSAARNFLEDFSNLVSQPKSIVIISAHWQSDALALSKAGDLETIHDFWGFPEHLYQQRYNAKQSEELSSIVEQQLTDAGLSFHHQDRGLDHGAWSVLKLAYPRAQIPILALSLPNYKQPESYIDLGKALKPLRQKDILIIGSGSAIHNLRELSFNNTVPAWAKEFKAWLHKSVADNNYDALANLYKSAPHGGRAHPSFEHYSPLLVAMGAAFEESAQLVHDSDEYSVLNNSSWLFG
jgi:4,5-DOPA dioxygenase extradiol